MIIDRLTKSAHFLPVNVEDSLEKLAQLYVDEIVRLHGGSSFDSFRSRPQVHIQVLAQFVGSFRYLPLFQHNISSSSGGSVRENHSDVRGHVESLCDGIQGELGYSFGTDGVRLQ